MEVIASFLSQVDGCQAGSVFRCRQCSRIAVGQDTHARFQQGQSVFAHGFAGGNVFFVDFFRFCEEQVFRRYDIAGLRFPPGVPHAFQCPGKVDGCWTGSHQIVFGGLQSLCELFRASGKILYRKPETVCRGDADSRCSPNLQGVYGVPDVFFCFRAKINFGAGQPGLIQDQPDVTFQAEGGYFKCIHSEPPCYLFYGITNGRVLHLKGGRKKA